MRKQPARRHRGAMTRRAAVAAAAAVATGAFAFAVPAAHAGTIEAEGLTLSPAKTGQVIGDSAASAGNAFLIWSNGTITKSTTTTAATSQIQVRAKGQQCKGAPAMVVKIDGKSVLSANVTATAYTTFSAPVSVPAGTHTVSVSYTNDDAPSGCDRNLIVDTITLNSPAPAATPTPAPTTAPAPGVAAFEAETMAIPTGKGQVLPDASASAGSEAALWYSTAATKTATTAAGKLTIRAKGTSCNGAAHMKVSVDGTQVLDTDVTTSWADYTPAAAIAAGSHAFSVELTNDTYQGATCDRNLYVDKLTLGNAATTPVITPTPTPTAPVTTPTPTAPVVTPTPTAPVVTPTPTPTAPADNGKVIFNGDFANGLSAWTGKIHPERISVVDDPILGSARKVAKFTVLDSDIGPTENPRAQLEAPYNMTNGNEYWVGWSTLLPKDFPTYLPNNGWITFESVYGPPFNNTGPIGMRVYNTGSNAVVKYQRNTTYNWDTAWQLGAGLNLGRWTDYVWHIKLSTDPNVGFVELYVNTGNGYVQQSMLGKQRLYMKTMDSSNSGGANDFRLNLYRQKGMFQSLTLYHASPKVGTSFAAVAPHSYGN